MNVNKQIIHIELIIPEELAGQRLDQALAKLIPQHSRARLQEWIKNQEVTVNGEHRRPRDKIHGGEAITIKAEIADQERWQAQDINLDLVHVDEDIIIVNKAAGLVVHPAAGNPDRTLVNALLYQFPELDKLPRAGIIHRIDKETTGLLAIAHNLEAHTHLTKQLQERRMHREYLALAQGTLTAGSTISEPIGRHPSQRTKMAIVQNGKAAITHYRIAERFPAHTLLKVQLETGRTHQIRVHLAHIKHPLVGDPVYGGRLRLPKGASDELIAALRHFKRQALHAKKLILQHPRTGEDCEFMAPLPEDFEQLLKALREDRDKT